MVTRGSDERDRDRYGRFEGAEGLVLRRGRSNARGHDGGAVEGNKAWWTVVFEEVGAATKCDSEVRF